MMIITSAQNAMVKKLALLLRDGRCRAEEGCLILEGEKAVFDAISRGHACLNLVLSEGAPFENLRGQNLAAGANGIQPFERPLRQAQCSAQGPAKPFEDYSFVRSALPSVQKTTTLSRDVFEKVSLMKQSTGVMGVFPIPEWDPALWQQATGQIALLDAVQSPQNVGAIIRNAAAFGVSALILLPGSADPTHPEVLRASAGYALDVPIFRGSPESVTAVASRFSVLILSAEGQLCVGRDRPQMPCLWVLGNEGQGPTWTAPHATSARIAMMPEVESLNVAVASGICFHAGFLEGL